MHWAYQYAKELKEKAKDEIIVAAGTSPSGTVHIGNFRDIITSYFIVEALKRQGKKAKLLFSWDDYDRLRKTPKNIPESKKDEIDAQIGKPYSEIQSPYDDGKSYAQHFEEEYEQALKAVGIIPDIIRYQSDEYKSGRYKKQSIFAIQNRKKIFDIIDSIRTQDATSEEREAYYPISIYCECCGKDNTKVLRDNGTGEVLEYHCEDCERDFTLDLRKNVNFKLPWKIDWPMRWKEEGVDLEPGGKDHAALQGSYNTSKIISKEVFGYEAPKFIGYEFIGIRGLAGKMSSSSGINISLGELLKVYPPEIIRWMYAKRKPNDAFNIDLGKDVPRVYKEFDRAKETYFDHKEELSEEEVQIMELALGDDREKREEDKKVIPFDVIVSIFGASNRNLKVMGEMLRKLGFDSSNTKDLKDRLSKAMYWAETYSKDSIIKVNSIHNKEYFEQLPEERKQNILRTIEMLNDEESEEQIMRMLYSIPGIGLDECSDNELKARQKVFFKDIYNLLISQDRGPKVAMLIKAIGTDKVKNILQPTREVEKGQVEGDR